MIANHLYNHKLNHHPNQANSLNLLNNLLEACRLGQELIGLIKLEAESLHDADGAMSLSLVESKSKFVAAQALALENLHGNESAFSPEAYQALEKLQELIFEMGTASLDSLILAYPDKVDYRYQRAGVLLSQGRDTAAQQDYLAVLSLEPSHFATLTDFGNLLMESGQHDFARSFFMQAVSAHPDQPLAHINFADLLLSQADYAKAKHHYQTALNLDPESYIAHQGLALALSGLGDETSAAAHRESGFRGKAMITWPHRGTNACIELLVLSSAFGGNIPIKHAIDERTFQASVILTEYFDPTTPLPAHQLVINLIGDADLCQAGLTSAETILAATTAPVINHPAIIRNTSRLDNAQRLANLPNVRTPRILLLSRAELSSCAYSALLTAQGLEFPLLLRSRGFHTGQFFIRVETANDLVTALNDLPGNEILGIELLDARNQQGDYQKYRVMFVDGELYPLHLAISKNWKVHYFSSEMDACPEHRELEAAFLNDMPAVLGDKAMTALRAICQELKLDYGGIDFSVDSDGKILLFEANATMVVPRPVQVQKWAYRSTATEKILKAIQTMLIKRANSYVTHSR